MKYIASVKYDNELMLIEREYPSKKAFRSDLVGNGMTVHFIATEETFDEECEKYHARLEKMRTRARIKRDTEKFSNECAKKAREKIEKEAVVEEIVDTAEEIEITAETVQGETATHIVEVVIISKVDCKYAVVYYSDGTTTEAKTATPEVKSFINLMVSRGCFEVILGNSCSCVKVGGCYRNADEFDISISAELDIRVDEHFSEMPFDKYDEGIWYHATGYSVLIDTRFVTEYSA